MVVRERRVGRGVFRLCDFSGNWSFPACWIWFHCNRSRGTVPIFAAEEVLVEANRLSPRKWDCPLRPVRAQARERLQDRHLLAAALAADRIIITLDESLKSALKPCPDGVTLLKTIRWIHPVADGSRALEAL